MKEIKMKKIKSKHEHLRGYSKSYSEDLSYRDR